MFYFIYLKNLANVGLDTSEASPSTSTSGSSAAPKHAGGNPAKKKKSLKPPSLNMSASTSTTPAAMPENYQLPKQFGSKTVNNKMANPKAIFILKEISSVLRTVGRSMQVFVPDPKRVDVIPIITKLVKKYPHFKSSSNKAAQVVYICDFVPIEIIIFLISYFIYHVL